MTWESTPSASYRSVVRGQRAVFTESDFRPDTTSGIVQVASPKTVIDVQFPSPGTWALVLTPPAYEGNPQIWPMSADEELLNTQMFSPLANFRIRYRLRFGAGGTTTELVGAWPQMGQTLKLQTDTLRLEVIPQFSNIF
jgi:hypothetical protein